MRYFVTGGAGFIGSHLVDALSTHHDVTVFDSMVSAVIAPEKQKNRTYIQGDVRDLETITNAMQQHDVVIHMAAAHLRSSLASPIDVHEGNGTGTLTTLLATKKNTIKRYIYISSSEVYGTAREVPMKESHPIIPTTVYGVSKYIGELYTRQFHEYENLKTTIIRPFNTYGPRSHFDRMYGEVIPRMTIRALNNLPPLIFGDGSQTRDFTYVADTVAGILAVLQNDASIGETWNIACGKEISIATISNLILQETNPSLKPTYKPARPNDVMRHTADITKAKTQLAFTPSISIESGIKQYVTWVKKTYPDTKSLLKKIPETNW